MMTSSFLWFAQNFLLEDEKPRKDVFLQKKIAPYLLTGPR